MALEDIDRYFKDMPPELAMPAVPAATPGVSSLAPEPKPAAAAPTPASDWDRVFKGMPADLAKPPAPPPAPAAPTPTKPVPPAEPVSLAEKVREPIISAAQTIEDYGKEVGIGGKLGMAGFVGKGALIDPRSAAGGMGIYIPTDAPGFENVPETPGERKKVAEEVMAQGLFPEHGGKVPEPKTLTHAVIRGLAESWPALIELMTLSGFAAPIEGMGAAATIGRSAIPFALSGAISEEPVMGAVKGGLMGGALGTMHRFTAPIESQIAKWAARIGGGLTIGGVPTALGGGSPSDIARDALIFGLFEAWGMGKEVMAERKAGRVTRDELNKALDKQDKWFEEKGVPQETRDILRTAPVESPEYIKAVSDTGELLKEAAKPPAPDQPISNTADTAQRTGAEPPAEAAPKVEAPTAEAKPTEPPPGPPGTAMPQAGGGTVRLAGTPKEPVPAEVTPAAEPAPEVKAGVSEIAKAPDTPMGTAAGAAETTAKESAPAPATAKQPWEMTRDEFEKFAKKGKLNKATGEATETEKVYAKQEVKTPLGSGIAAGYSPEDIAHFYAFRRGAFNEKLVLSPGYDPIEAGRREFIEDAIKEGLPVPSEVLADYPDLAAKVTPTPPVAPVEATPAPEALAPAPIVLTPKVKKPRVYNLARAVEQGDAATIVRAFGGFDSQSPIIKENFEPEEQKLIRLFSRKAEPRGPRPQRPDELLQELKTAYPHIFPYESDADFLMAIADGSIYKTADVGKILKDQEAHYAEIEEQAASEGLDKKALAQADADAKRELDNERAISQREESAGDTSPLGLARLAEINKRLIDLETQGKGSSAEARGLRDEQDYIDSQSVEREGAAAAPGRQFRAPEEALGLRAPERPETKFEKRLRGIQEIYPDADPARLSETLRLAPNQSDHYVYLMSMLPLEEAMAMSKGNLSITAKEQLLKKATDLGTQISFAGMGRVRDTLFRAPEEKGGEGKNLYKETDFRVEQDSEGLFRVYDRFDKAPIDAFDTRAEADEFVKGTVGFPIGELYEPAKAEAGVRPGGVEGRQALRLLTDRETGGRVIEDFRAREEGLLKSGEDNVWSGVQYSDRLANHPDMQVVHDMLENLGLDIKIVPTEGGWAPAALVQTPDGPHMLLDYGKGFIPIRELAGHEIFHHRVNIGDPKAIALLGKIDMESPAFIEYMGRVNALYEEAGYQKLGKYAVAHEIAADFAGGRKFAFLGEMEPIRVAEAFGKDAKSILAEYSEGMPAGEKAPQAELPPALAPPGRTEKEPWRRRVPSELYSRADDVALNSRNLSLDWYIEEAKHVIELVKSGDMDGEPDGGRKLLRQMQNFIDSTQKAQFRAPEEKAPEALTGLKEEPKDSAEVRQEWLDRSEPRTYKQFRQDLDKNEREMYRRLSMPGNTEIPLYIGERFTSRAGNQIIDAKGRTRFINEQEMYERFYKPQRPQLEEGQQAFPPNPLLPPEGTVDPPPNTKPGRFAVIERSVNSKISVRDISKMADFAAQSVQEWMGWSAREASKARNLLDKLIPLFKDMPREELYAFEEGRTDREDLKEAAKTWKRLSDGFHLLVADAKGGEFNYWKDYFPRMFKNPELAQSIIAEYLASQGRRGGGGGGFEEARTKLTLAESIKPKLEVWPSEGKFDVVERNIYDNTKKTVQTFDTEAEARDLVKEKGGLGLEMIDENYATMMKANLWEKARWLQDTYIREDLERAKLIQQGKQPGWVPLPDRGIWKGWYAHPDVAEVIDKHLSPGLRNDPLFKMYYEPFSFMNEVFVGFSLFHMSFSTLSFLSEGVGMNVPRMLGAALTGNWEAAKFHGKQLLKTLNVPGSLAESGQYIKQYVEPGTFPQHEEMVDALQRGGIRVKSGPFSDMMNSFVEAAKESKVSLPREIVRLIGAPTMQFVVPRFKMIAEVRRMETELFYARQKAAKEGRTLTRGEITELAQKVSRVGDYVYGQMVYDNVGMKRGWKDLLSLWIGFPGWNLGSFGLMKDAMMGMTHLVKEPAKYAAETLTGGKPEWKSMPMEHRAGLEFFMGMSLVMAIGGAIINRLLTGEFPKDAKDLFMPRTGALLPNGTPERMRMPTYLRDVLSLNHPIDMLAHKQAFPLRLASALVANQDYFGTQISDPYAGTGTQVGQKAEYLGKSLLPFGIQGFMKTESPQGAALNVLGITPTPRQYTNTAAQNVIDEYNKLTRPTTTTKETAEMKTLKRDLRKLAKDQDEAGFQAASEKAITEGHLTRQQVKEIVDESQMPPGLGRFTKLPIEWAARAWDVASDFEKEQWQPFFLKKIMGAKPESLIAHREVVVKVLDDMGMGEAANQVRNLSISEKGATVSTTGLGEFRTQMEMAGTPDIDAAMAQAIGTRAETLGEPKRVGMGARPPTDKKKKPYEVLGL